MTRPTCAACGKGLPKFVDASDLRARRITMHDPAWRKASAPPELTADGMPPTRGRLGDNLVCGMACGYKLAIRLVASDPGVLKLLPPGVDPSLMAAIATMKRRDKSRERRKARKERATAAAKKVVVKNTFGVEIDVELPETMEDIE